MTIKPTISTFKKPVSLLAILILSSGLSCAVAPESGSQPDTSANSASDARSSATVKQAYESYQRRDFESAAAAYDDLIADGGGNAQNLRLAHLGKVLIHLSTDPKFRDLNAAGRSLQAAESINAGSASVESGMLMNALSSLVGVEKNITELNSKAGNSSFETAKLKQQLEAALAEQEVLNEALEKLKALTIGN